MLKWLTLGLFGRSKAQGVFRRARLVWRAGKFGRGSYDKTLKIVQEYFPDEIERNTVMERLGDRFSTDLFFDTVKDAESFVKSLTKVGWYMDTDSVFYTHADIRASDCTMFFPTDRTYFFIEGEYWCPEEQMFVSEFSIYREGKRIFSDETHDEVFDLSKLKPKEALKYVA